MRNAVIVLVWATSALILGVYAEDQVGSVKTANLQAQKPVSKSSLTVPRVATDDLVAALKDDDVFLRIGDHDVLRWGIFRRHLDALEDDIELGRPRLQSAIKSSTYRARLRRLLKEYVQYGVLAVAAKKIGIKTPDEEFVKYRAMARKKYASMGNVGKRLTKLMDEPESFYEHNLTNALLWLEYKDKVIAPKVKVEDATIDRLIATRHQANVRRASTNEVKRVLIKDILKKIRNGMDFAEAARRWSDCDSAEDGGLLMDDEDESKPARCEASDLHPAIAAACFKLKEGEISEVAETPFAWHIMKVVKRHPATADTSETVELAHIMLEKVLLKPEYDRAAAREMIWKKTLKSAVDVEFVELYKQTKIECKIPIMDAGSGSRPKGAVVRPNKKASTAQ